MKQPRNTTTQQLLDWLDGRLDTDQIAALEARLTAADTAELRWLQTFKQRTADLGLVSPPDAVRQAVRDLLPTASHPSTWQTLKSKLTFDSWGLAGGLALAGTRATATSDERQLVYETEIANIVLDIVPTGETDTYTINGQVYPRTADTSDQFTIQLLKADQLLQADDEQALLRTDDLGEFSLTDLNDGTYSLIFVNDTIELHITALHL